MVRRLCPIAGVSLARDFVSQQQFNSFSRTTPNRIFETSLHCFVISYIDIRHVGTFCFKVPGTLPYTKLWNRIQHPVTRLFCVQNMWSSHSLKTDNLHIMSGVAGDVSSPEITPKRKKSTTAENDDDLKQFDKLFNVLVEDLNDYANKNSEISDALKWFKQVNEYNVPYGKKNRGLTVVHSYRFLVGNSCSEEGVRLAMVLGWCIEWLQAYFLVADDIMDSSVTRRGQPCWFRRQEVGLTAINDSFYLEAAIYFLLKKYCRHLSYYADILDLFHETTLQTVIGQNLDLITAPTNRVDFTAFTIERYNTIVKYKTAFYSFYLPVACAMYMAGIDDSVSHDNAKLILLKMGEFFQIQDDFLDCFGAPEVTGKVGTDIEDNKCSWLIVQALNKATNEQRVTLEANYAQHDSECVDRVKAIYNELGIPELYANYEEDSYSSISELINSVCGTLPRQMFITFVNKIYKRKK